ncbi:MAG: HAMP domain-containing histidine kinase [Acidobacteria bacterium]|nr:HAMP domain-containing histidine kinase [Acidobacteriota bacterium]
MLVLLPLLAVLQYRWLGEVSAAERERMQANLKTSAERFCSDFDRELTVIYTQIQNLTEPNLLQPNQAEANLLSPGFAARYSQWAAGNPKTKLISGVYRIGDDASGKLALAVFNSDSGIFQLSDWPDKLLPLRQRFEAQRQSNEAAQATIRSIFNGKENLKTLGKGQGFFLKIQNGVTADDIPALVIPDAHLPNLPPVLERKSASTVVVLNEEFIKTELLPSLAKRYFSADGDSEFNLAVIRRNDPANLIYRTGASPTLNDFEKSDAQTSFFKIRLDDADRILIRSVGTSPLQMESAATPAPGITQSSTGYAVRVTRADVVGQTKQIQKVESVEQAISLPKHLPGLMSEDGGWRLLVKHRAGSLEAAVGNVRRRNLVISFGILLLLGASVGFIVISSRRAERLAAQQMEFVAGVSHELRTPLAVICSAAENLADGVIDNSDQIKRYGGLIRDEGRRLTGMVEQVLEFAGAQSGRKTYELRPTDLNYVIEDAVAACHLQLVEGGFELEKNVPADLPMVNADAAALSRAIQNLLNNAMKYSGDSRWIGLSAESVKTDNGEEVQIKVSDQGLGIAASELSHIFEPFYRGKEVVASQIHGNGLGLSLVKHIVDEHGGEVKVESNPKRGSNFTLSLPVVPTDQPISEMPREAYEQTHPVG